MTYIVSGGGVKLYSLTHSLVAPTHGRMARLSGPELPQGGNPQNVTNPSSNRARCSLTLLPLWQRETSH